MAIEIVTPPVAEPVALADAKLFLRVDDDAEDDLITQLIASARERVETECACALITRRVREFRDAWRQGGRLTSYGAQFRVGLGPLSTVHHVKTYDADGVASTFDPANYFVDTRSLPGRIALIGGAVWPEPGRAADGVEIEYDAGYGAASSDAPRPLVEAIRLLIAESYETRMPSERAGEAGLPPAVRDLIAPFRQVRL